MTPELAELYNVTPERLAEIRAIEAKRIEEIRKHSIPTLGQILGVELYFT